MAAELVLNSRSGVEGFAQGGIYKECLAISSKDGGAAYVIPNGTKIYVAPALWHEDQVSKWQLGNSPDFDPVWEFTFTNAPGTYGLNLINIDAKYKNMRCVIRVFTASLFIVGIEYVALADSHDFLYPYTYQPLQLFTKQSTDLSKLNVYNTANRTIGVRVSIDSTTWLQSDYYVQGIPWKFVNYPSVDNRYFLEVNGKTANGFILGQDLKVNLRNFPQYTNSQYYAGIFRVDELLGMSMEFYDEIFLQYAKANNTADEPFELATNTIARNRLKDFHGFRFDNFESIADFTIDDQYFEAGGRYRCFLITKEECQYKCYLFDEFGEAAVHETIYGDIDIDSVDIDGISLNIANGSCLYDVPVCSEMVYVAKMNIASYEAALLAAGLGGTWADYFSEAFCYISEGVNQLGVNPFPDSVEYEETGGEAIITFTFKIPEDWQGDNKVINFVWVFDYGVNQDYITAYTSLQMHVSDDTDIELKGAALPDEICDIDAIPLNLCFENPSATHKFFIDLLKDGVKTEDALISNQEADFSTNSDACLDFDFEEAESETEYCLKMRAHKQTTNALPAPCEDLELTLFRIDVGGQPTYWIQGDIPVWVDADVSLIQATFKDQQGFSTIVTVFNSKDFWQQWTCAFSPVSVEIIVVRSDGYQYNVKGTFAWSKDKYEQTLIINLCSGIPFQYCDENPILSHTIVWNYNAVGQLPNKTVTPNFLNPGVFVSQVKQYRLNGGAWVNYTVPLTIAPSWKVEFRWELTYTDCVIELYDCLTEEPCAFP